jgi:hypothetical protein
MTKLEQVARAIADALNMEQSPHMYEPEDTLRAARAAVEVLREPTAHMISEGYDHFEHGGSEAVWPAMVDAILSEKPE